jgi:hypothetical protein
MCLRFTVANLTLPSLAYFHPDFVREFPEKAATIHHTNNKGKRGRRPHSKLTEPDFYSMNVSGIVPSPSTEGKIHAPVPTGSLFPEQVTPMASTTIPGPNENEPLDRPDTSLMTSRFLYPPEAPEYTQGQGQAVAQWQPTPLMQPDRSVTFPSLPSGLSDGTFHQQHQIQPLPVSAMSAAANAPARGPDMDLQVPPPMFERQTNVFSIGEGFGELGDEEDILNRLVERQDSFSFRGSARASMEQPLPPQRPQLDRKERLNLLIHRNQQMQRDLQLQHQQLEQERSELLRGDQHGTGRPMHQIGMAQSSYQVPPLSQNLLVVLGQQQLQDMRLSLNPQAQPQLLQNVQEHQSQFQQHSREFQQPPPNPRSHQDYPCPDPRDDFYL